MNTNIHCRWLVENFEQDNKIWKLIAELKRRGQPLEVIDYYNFSLNNKVVDGNGMPTNSSFKDDDCVIFQGSIQLALWIKRNKPWIPGVWLDADKLKCTYYYSHLGEFLFNEDYEFTTVGEYKRKYLHYFAKYGKDDCLFVRPNSGLKSFTGQLFYKERHATDWAYFNQCSSAEDIVVVSSPKVTGTEYRVVIANGEPITASMYYFDGKSKQLPGAPKEVYEFAEKVATVIDREMGLAPMYVVDVVVCGGQAPKLMEVNCFNCAGLYECDKGIIVDAANRAALAEYDEYKKDEIRPS